MRRVRPGCTWCRRRDRGEDSILFLKDAILRICPTNIWIRGSFGGHFRLLAYTPSVGSSAYFLTIASYSPVYDQKFQTIYLFIRLASSE